MPSLDPGKGVEWNTRVLSGISNAKPSPLALTGYEGAKVVKTEGIIRRDSWCINCGTLNHNLDLPSSFALYYSTSVKPPN